MDIISFFTFFAFFACILSIFGVSLSLYACIIAKSLERATHTVQMVPIDQEFSNNKDLENINTEQKETNEDFFNMV
jgi:hypothetical protein